MKYTIELRKKRVSKSVADEYKNKKMPIPFHLLFMQLHLMHKDPKKGNLCLFYDGTIANFFSNSQCVERGAVIGIVIASTDDGFCERYGVLKVDFE